MNPYKPPRDGSLEEESHDAEPKRNLFHEAMAAGLMIFGAVALVYTLFPWINPIQYEMNASGDESMWGRLVIGGGVTAALLAGAFHFNRKKPLKPHGKAAS